MPLIIKHRNAFTLVELLVVIAIIALLMGVLMPALAAARSQAYAMVCRSNIRQLVTANIGYATGNDGYFVPAASDMWSSFGGMHRWHGVRENQNAPFDPLKGPLVSFLGDGKIKECPGRVKLFKGTTWAASFEKGAGGYGYNMAYIGSRLWQSYTNENHRRTTQITELTRPAETLMFADCAMANKDLNGNDYIHEYSFAQPPFFLNNGEPQPSWGYASPSIHFRHRGRANIGWADGHVGCRQRAEFNENNAYGVNSAMFNLGWFEPLDNSPFDLK